MSAQRTSLIPRIRPASRLDGLRPYEPPSHATAIELRLDANEGQPSDSAVDAARRAVDAEALCRYPDSGRLERLIAERWGVDPARVVVTNGGDDAIDRVCRSVLEPGKTALLHTPTFEMIERSARLAGGRVRFIEWAEGDFPADCFIQSIESDTVLVALVTPNNPTGGVIAKSDLVEISKAAEREGAVVLVDLAYAEFADVDPTLALLERPNVVAIRTFSKAKGLAGLRVGYAIAPPEVAGWMRTVGGPYPVSSISLAVAEANLAEDAAQRERIERVRVEREALGGTLRQLGASPLSSDANFVTARFAHAGIVCRALAGLGVGVRGFPGREGLADCLRITLPADEAGYRRLDRSLYAVMRPEALLLDLDGVIADVSGSYRAAILETARTYGVELTPGQVSAAKRAGDANNDWELTRNLLRAQDVPAELGEIVTRFQAIYLGLEGEVGVREREGLIPDAGVLQRLASRLPLALVTGRPRDEAEWFLARFGLSSLMSDCVCMEDAPAKPSPDPVRLAVRSLGVSLAWMVGDTPDDMRSAQAAGVVPIGVVAPEDDESATRAALLSAGAAVVIGSLEDLEEMLS